MFLLINSSDLFGYLYKFRYINLIYKYSMIKYYHYKGEKSEKDKRNILKMILITYLCSIINIRFYFR